MRNQDAVYPIALIIGLLLVGPSWKLVSVLELLMIAAISRLALRQIPLEFATLMVAIAGANYGPLVGAYVGFFAIVLPDVTWMDFSNTLWCAPTFALVGYLAGIISLPFVILVGVLTLLWNLILSTITTAIYGGSIIMTVGWILAYILVNMGLAYFIGPKISLLLV